MSKNVLEEITIIKNHLDQGIDYKKEKKKFFKIVDFVKVNKIKDDDIVNSLTEIRNSMAKTWRPKQFTLKSGLLLWSFLIFFGGFLIYCTFLIWDNLQGLGIWMHVLYVFALIFGWLCINMGIHNMGHFIAGEMVGIKFNSWVIREAIFQWALIIDYETYLKSTFRKRQFLHVAGPFCTLITPWIMYLITMNPIMIGIGIYMFIASMPVIVRKKWDYGRIAKERELKKESKKS